MSSTPEAHSSSQIKQGTFYPSFWVADGVEQSRRVVVEYESTDFEGRWKHETEFTIDLIGKYANITDQTKVLDYGSGVGRLAKPLIEKFGCRVDAYEPSADLRRHSLSYVQSPLYNHVEAVNKYDLIICAWVALLIEDIEDLYGMFASMLNKGGMLLIVDYEHQILSNDGVNFTKVWNGKTKNVLNHDFEVLYNGVMPDKYINKLWAEANTFPWHHTFWAFAKPKQYYEHEEENGQQGR